jgi:hypothetical protein
MIMRRRMLATAGTSTGLALVVSVLAILIWSREAIPQRISDRDASLLAWQRVASVLQHPRCLNCHQPNEPMQGDRPRPHKPKVVRGRDNQGAPGMRCASCHSPFGNNEASRAPGATRWKMPPRSMTWGGLSVGDICRAVRNPAKNGGRSPRALVKHFEEDSLVHWSWSPGSDREAAPFLFEVFLEFVQEWVQTGMHCPE